MIHTIFKWGFFLGMPLTIYLSWDGWGWSAGILGVGTFLFLCVAAYTE